MPQHPTAQILPRQALHLARVQFNGGRAAEALSVNHQGQDPCDLIMNALQGLDDRQPGSAVLGAAMAGSLWAASGNYCCWLAKQNRRKMGRGREIEQRLIFGAQADANQLLSNRIFSGSGAWHRRHFPRRRKQSFARRAHRACGKKSCPAILISPPGDDRGSRDGRGILACFRRRYRCSPAQRGSSKTWRFRKGASRKRPNNLGRDIQRMRAPLVWFSRIDRANQGATVSTRSAMMLKSGLTRCQS